MSRTFFFILIIVFLFIGINSVFYFTIYNQQLDFQTELLTRQARVCGSAIEQEGQRFENELNSIPYQDDFTRLFRDDEIKESGSINLQKLYTGYSQLINKITVYDDNNNVYSLILDLKNNFVSDYYESQRQIPLNEREKLLESNNNYQLSIPGFNENGVVESNIVVDINFITFINGFFERYTLERTLWQCLVTEEGELISTAGEDILIQESDLSKIAGNIGNEKEFSMVHTLTIDGLPTRVVSVIYPIRLVKRNMGIVFSIKTDLFLQSIITKIIIISLSSLVLLVLLLYIHFRVLRYRAGQVQDRTFSEKSFLQILDSLNLGFVFTDMSGQIQAMNQAAPKILMLEEGSACDHYADLGFDNAGTSRNSTVYQRAVGTGRLLTIRRGPSLKYIYKIEWQATVSEEDTKLLLLMDVSEIENALNLNKLSGMARSELIEKMYKELKSPLLDLKNSITGLVSKSVKPSPRVFDDLQKSHSLLSNLIDATLDFARRPADNAVREEIPYYVRSEIDLVTKAFRNGDQNISIITKIRNDVPEKIIGDPFRLRQTLSLLVENALELTVEGRIIICSEVLDLHPALLRLEFYVEDTGQGMDPEKISSIMEKLDHGNWNGPSDDDPFMQRLATARQHVELMRGQLWFESPSSISTNPDQPGIKYSFTIDALPGDSIKENLAFNEIRRLADIQCLVLTQEKDVENLRFKPIADLGVNLKQLIYRQDNPESAFELISQKSFHVLIITHSEKEDGMGLADEIIRRDLIGNRLILLLSSDHKQTNQMQSRDAGIDYYIEEPFESYHIVEIFTRHFPELSKEDLSAVPDLEQVDPDLSVLLAEDNLFNRKLIQGLFKRLGLEIDLAENGKQAVDMASDKEYDIIFMDLLMPEKDGLQAAQEIRDKTPDARIVALTAVDNPETKKEAMDKGLFNDYLIKPASAERLRRILLNKTTGSSATHS
jgi:CheY-like chemotaxis protein/signal transduction histidine kinase